MGNIGLHIPTPQWLDNFYSGKSLQNITNQVPKGSIHMVHINQIKTNNSKKIAYFILPISVYLFKIW